MTDFRLFFIFCLIVLAGAGIVTFYNNNNAWHALVIGISSFLWALYMLHDKESK